jgi:signal transduction histidine kinase
MSLWRQRSDLGPVEPCLRLIGLAIWLFVGASRLAGPAQLFLEHGRVAPTPWVWPWLGFGAAFVVASLHRRLPPWIGGCALAFQGLCVLPLPHMGFGGFEGLLLSVVVAQAPTLMSLRWAVVWTVVQAIPLVVTVWNFNSALEITEILGAYSTFCAFALLVYWLQLREREARSSLAQANVELVGARSLVVEGVRQAERLRISRELHDNLGHQLTALRLQLELAGRHDEPSATQNAVVQAQALSRDAMTDLRTVVSAIQAEDWTDFPAALHALAAGLPGTSIHVDAVDGFTVTGEVGRVLFRCIQEGVTNSLKHSGGNGIWITLSQDAENLEISVRDDGLAPRQFTHGFGLRSIEARAAQLGGVAVAGRGPNGGFQVRLVVPRGRA